VNATTNGLKGDYFDTLEASGYRFSRIDARVDFDWGTGSPDPSISPNTFAVRWTGYIEPKYSESYTFYTVSDDGVRLWVNEQPLVDNWSDHPPTENIGQIALVAGQLYPIRLEYFQNLGGSVIQLSWSSASQPKEIVPQGQLVPDAQFGFLWFKRPTDTIQITGQTVIGNEATFEARILFPTNASAEGFVFAEWTSGQESKVLSVGPSHVFGEIFPNGSVQQDVNLKLDQWHHIAFVYDLATSRLYVDGQMVANTSATPIAGNGNGLPQVGAIFRDGIIRNCFSG
jgi:hypothetical protein